MKKVLQIIGIILLCLLAIGIFKSKTIWNYHKVYRDIRIGEETACVNTLIKTDKLSHESMKICAEIAKCTADKVIHLVDVDTRYWYTHKYKYINDKNSTLAKAMYECSLED